MSTFNYIKVTGLSEAISTEDIVAHFQTARCGGGTVTEVIILGPHKSVGLVRIEQINLDCELLEGVYYDHGKICYSNCITCYNTITLS